MCRGSDVFKQIIRHCEIFIELFFKLGSRYLETFFEDLAVFGKLAVNLFPEDILVIFIDAVDHSRVVQIIMPAPIAESILEDC